MHVRERMRSSRGLNHPSVPLSHVPDIKILRKVDRHRNKTLHVDSALKRSSLVPPVAWNIRKKDVPGGVVALPPAVKLSKLASRGRAQVAGVKPIEEKKRERSLDPWNAEGEWKTARQGEGGSKGLMYWCCLSVWGGCRVGIRRCGWAGEGKGTGSAASCLCFCVFV